MYSPTSSPHSHTYQADSPSEWNLGDDQLEEEEAVSYTHLRAHET